ncbi:hypothetical protein H4R35_004322 [Dimargaris xerosporica]|nr:hypothetical protein H4R35_004322 [Dimargaris xerosporica]
MPRRRNARRNVTPPTSEDDPTPPAMLTEEEQEKTINDLKLEDERINAQFKIFLTTVSAVLTAWFMATAYHTAMSWTKQYYVPLTWVQLTTPHPLLSCESSVVALQIALYSLYKESFSIPYLVACSALFIFQFWLCTFGESPFERIWWTLPALMLGFNVYSGYFINVQKVRWSELEARQYKLKGA